MLSAEPVCSCAHSCCTNARETAGAARTRSSLRPLDEGGKFINASDALRRENAKLYPRRPGLDPGPIRCGPSVRTMALETFHNIEHHAVWVPAQGRDDSGARGNKK